MELKDLQNGSDIRGIAVGEGTNLTEEAARQLAAAFAAWLTKRTGKDKVRIAVGRDSRVSGPALLQAVETGLTDMGADVLDCAMASTPAMFMATVYDETDADGSVMITASHLPMNRNGMKFFTKDGGLEKEDIAALIDIAKTHPVLKTENPGTVTPVNLIDIYAADLVGKVRTATGKDRPLEGLNIIVDAGNGAGGFYAEKVLVPLGGDTQGSQFLDPDGHFPNHIPNPENTEAMASIVDAVRREDADFGIIFDTDVDRAGAVDKGGTVLNRNRLIALLSAILLKAHPGTTIVTDSVTSDGLADFIAKLGGVHHRFKRGYRNVINESIRLNNAGQDSALAIETSGHAAFKDNYFLDDGAYLVTQLLIQLARQDGSPVSALIEDLQEPVESVEFRFPIMTDKFRELGEKILAQLQAYAVRRDAQGIHIAPDNYEGIRIAFDKGRGDGWVLLRMSLHEPLMPLNIESTSSGGVMKMAEFMLGFLRTYPDLDISSLAAYIAGA